MLSRIKFKTIVKRVFQVLFIFILLFGLWNYKLLNYGISQAKGQLKIVRNAEEMEDVLASPLLSDTLKQKLHLIQEIKRYAEDSLGIKKTENYTTYYDQQGHSVMWMLMASYPFKMEAKEWAFPFLGKFSYKGYFDKKKARLEEFELKQLGFDTELGRAGGWSTLGWFRDPVLSTMLSYSKGELSSLIIHELTHSTLYVKNDVDFNENLASFIGEKGAEKFLIQKFGKKSEAVLNYKSNLEDEKLFEKYLVECTKQLKALYGSIENENDSIKLKKKKNLIFRFVVDSYKLPLKHKSKYIKRMKGALRSGNAFFMSYQRYDAQKDSLETILNTQYNGNIQEYLNHLKKTYSSL